MTLALALALGCAAPGSAAEVGNARWAVRSWQSDDGLPNNTVLSLAQTPDGYLWVATATRLARFDGRQFEIIPREIFGPAFARHLVGAVRPSRDGGLWLAMDQGPLVHASAGQLQFFAAGMPKENVQTMTEGSDDSVWLTYRGGSVWRVHDGRAQRLTAGDGMPVRSSGNFARDSVGTVWFAKGGAIGVVENDRFKTLVELPRNRAPAEIAAANGGGVWIATNTDLYRDAAGQGLIRCGSFQPDQRGDEASALIEDRRGGVWIGTAVNGVFHYDGATFERITTTHREISSLLEDREGNIWIGTIGGGLDQVRPATVALESAETGMPFESIVAVTQDTGGRVWTVAQNGWLLRRDANRWTNVSAQKDWPGGLASTVAADPNGGVWIGTKNRLLHHWLNGAYVTIGEKNGLAMRNAHALLVTRGGDVWIGGNAPTSLQRWQNGQLTNWKVPSDLRVIRAAIEDAAGVVWFGTSRGVLLRIAGDRVVDETPKMGGILSIRCLAPASDGSLWIGLADFGVGRLKDGRFVRLGTEQGLPDDGISQILFDDQGWVWFGSNQGVFKVRRDELETAFERRILTVHPVVFGRSDGLPNLQANAGESPNSLRDHDGQLWLPMTTGIVVARSEPRHKELSAPPVRLRRVTVDETVVASYGGAMPVTAGADLQKLVTALRLPPSHRRLEFEWTALSFGAPENVRFRYKLDGLEENWTDAAGRIATYSRLPAGRYAFRIQAAQANGPWNEMKAPLRFVVEPFFWQTWWFQLVVVGVFTALVAATVRYVSFRRLRSRVRALQEQAALEKERTRIARDIHDDVGNRLTKITLLSNLALKDRRQPEKTAAHIENISSTARQITDSLDEIVWAVNPRNDTLSHLIHYIGQYAVEFLDATQVRLELELPEHPPEITVPAEVRHNLFLVVKEALNNIVRHAGAERVVLRIAADVAGIGVAIGDDGRGFAGAPGHDGADGLHNMRQRMTEIGGACEITSQPGHGTNVQLHYRWVARQRN